MEVAWTIKYASQASIAIPILLVFRLRDFRDTVTVSIILLLFASFIADTWSSIEGARGNSNLYIANVYYVVQFVLLSILYSRLLPNFKSMIYFAISGYLSFFVLVTFYIQDIGQFQSSLRPVDSGVLIFFSCLYWYQIYVTKPTTSLRHYPQFWFNTAIFTYFTFNLFLFTIFNYLLKVSNEAALAIWIWHNLNNIAKNVLFAVGIFYLRR